MFDLRDVDFQRKLNSATKYPSIPTYHTINAKGSKLGMLSEPVVDFGDQMVQISEKIDGTNARVIVLPARGDWGPYWVIGSRENLLSCSEDWFKNPELGIVAELARAADDLQQFSKPGDPIRAYFFEVHGGSIGANAKQYTTDKKIFGHRLFDVIEFTDTQFESVMGMEREDVSSWRDRGGQPFVGWDDFLKISQDTNLLRAPIVDRRWEAENLPTSLQDALDWMKELLPGGSEAKLDPGAPGRAEGVVLKSHDRKITAKLRFQDYEGTLRRRNHEALKAGVVE
jgi:hypothetical protein